MGCLKTADDISLFSHVGTVGSPPQTVEQLATATSVPAPLLKRIVRHLTTRGVLADHADAPGSCSATHISAALATREGSAGIRAAFDLYLPTYLGMPRFLQEHAYEMPTDSRNTVLQAEWKATGKTLFECLRQPERNSQAEDFHLLMQFLTKGRRSFLEVCDMRELLGRRAAATPADTVAPKLFVDVGGGTGTDAIAFRSDFKDAPGAVELQDQPNVIETARKAGVEEQNVELRAVDFFEPQPSQGARFYYMSSVLHDWPDQDAKRILENIVAAMRPGYSTLLLSENVLPEVGCHPHLSAMDLTMMNIVASKERSENDWHALLTEVGLEVLKVHSIPSCLKSVLECELR